MVIEMMRYGMHVHRDCFSIYKCPLLLFFGETALTCILPCAVMCCAVQENKGMRLMQHDADEDEACGGNVAISLVGLGIKIHQSIFSQQMMHIRSLQTRVEKLHTCFERCTDPNIGPVVSYAHW
eukprot:14577221-Ditylum_brightwellii.AAC.1